MGLKNQKNYNPRNGLFGENLGIRIKLRVRKKVLGKRSKGIEQLPLEQTKKSTKSLSLLVGVNIEDLGKIPLHLNQMVILK